ncbi:MAG TPA: AAA family ATPase [Acidimicrobiia bacterium]|nr:hypothetical protein [uncultured bacterium]
MTLSGRPLLDTEPDHQLFAGRNEELYRLLGLVRGGVNTLVVGDRGSGKTTLLRQLAFVLRRDAGSAPAFVEGRLAETPREFLDLVRARLGLPPYAPIEGDLVELPAVIGALGEAVTESRRVVLVDEVSPSVGATIFGRLRDEVWQLPLVWVIAVTPDDAAALRVPPADAFFEAVVPLEDLTWEEQRELLEARLGREGAEMAAQVDEGNPRRLIALARAAKETGIPAALQQEAMERRRAAVAQLGRPATMLMAELESLGPVSASDQRLLQRLGWTRSRAVQVFRELENAGLVTSAFAKGPAGGRQKVYRPVDSWGDE